MSIRLNWLLLKLPLFWVAWNFAHFAVIKFLERLRIFLKSFLRDVSFRNYRINFSLSFFFFLTRTNNFKMYRFFFFYGKSFGRVKQKRINRQSPPKLISSITARGIPPSPATDISSTKVYHVSSHLEELPDPFPFMAPFRESFE